MISRSCHASSRLLASTRVRRDARLTFSLSAVIHVRRLPQRSLGERAHPAALGRRPGETEDGAKENKSDENESEEEEEIDHWLLAGQKKVHESQIRSYKNPYEHFRKNVAPLFRESSPRNWLGRDVPFPLNLTFKPPVPLSDELRTRLYRIYMTNPNLNDVRALATRHNISIKRVRAILRLKGMEKSWEKGKPLQTGFTNGMERLLGVTEAMKRKELNGDELVENDFSRQGDWPDSPGRYDVGEADLQDEAEGSCRARQRYQRLFWESVAEGEEPVMSAVLEAQRSTSLARTKYEGKTTLVERAPGRPAIVFVDVGNAFVDEKEKERREREGARRSALKAQKRMRKHGLHT